MNKYHIILLIACLGTGSVRPKTFDPLTLALKTKIVGYVLDSQHHISEQDYRYMADNPTQALVYIPHTIKMILNTIHSHYSQLNELIQPTPLLHDTTHVVPYDQAKNIIQCLYDVLESQEVKTEYEQTLLPIIKEYKSDLESGFTHIVLEQGQHGEETVKRGHHYFQAFRSIFTQFLTAGSLTVDTSALIKENLNVMGNEFIQGNLTVNGTINGPMSALGTTDHAVQVGNAQSTLTSLPVGTNGQVLIAATNANPAFATLTSVGGSISFIGGPNNLNLEATGGTVSSFNTDTGPAMPAAGLLNVFGGTNMNTAATGPNTISINLNASPSVAGSLTAGTTVTGGTGLRATTGGLIVSAGGITSTGTTTLNSLGAGVMNTSAGGVVSSTATTNHAVQVGNASGTLTSLALGSTGQVLTSNGAGANPSFQAPASATISIAGDSGGPLVGSAFTFTGVPTGLTFSGSGSTQTLTGTLAVSNGGTGATSLTDHGVLVGSGTAAITPLAVGSDGQVLIGASGLDPAFASLASSNSSINFTSGANTLDLTTGTAVATSFVTGINSPAIPAAGVLNVPNGSNITTTGSSGDNTLTIDLVSSPSVSGSVTAGTGLIATTGGATITGTSSVAGTAAATALTVTAGAAQTAVAVVGSTTLPAQTITAGANSKGLTIQGNGTANAEEITAGAGTGGGLLITGGAGAGVPLQVTAAAGMGNAATITGNTSATALSVTAGAGQGGITSSGTTTLTALGAGVMNTNGSGVVASTATTNHAVQVGNATNTLTSLTVGTNGQVLIGSTGLDPVFNSLTSTGGSMTFTTGAGTLNLEASPVFGNVVRVDSVYGNNSTGARNGKPFLTITAALAAALSGDTVWISPGTYAESITIPSGVTVVGLSTGVTISQSVGVATDLVTMGTNSSLNNVTLSLSSTSHVQLRGVVFPTTTATNAQINNVTLTVNNSTAGAVGTSAVYGVYSNGTGSAGESHTNVQSCSITVNSAGSGSKRGVLLDTNANTFRIRNSSITVTNAGGAGSFIGAETNVASSVCTILASNISGPTADISQTLGTLRITGVRLVNSTANSLGFSTPVECSNIVWGYTGAIGAGTAFMRVGTAGTGANIQAVYANKALLVKSLAAQVRVTPGTSSTFRLYKNGILAGMQVVITNPATSAINNTQSVSFAAGDTIALDAVQVGANANDGTVIMELY
jgi:hypothetical protein